MVLKKIIALPIAICLALSSLFALAFMGNAQAAGSTIYWCDTTDGSFSNASNWSTSDGSCTGGVVPASGDSLVFDTAYIDSTVDVTNDMSSLSLNNITFQGTGTSFINYELDGNAISLSGGITIGSNYTSINLPIILTGNQQLTESATSHVTFGNSASINLATNNLTVALAITNLSLPTLSGSGTLTLNSGTSANYSSASTFTGSIVIESGATLVIDSTSNTYTLPNDLTIAGEGVSGQGAIQSCLGSVTTCEDSNANTTLTLSGNVSLTGNAEVANGLYTSGESSPPSNTATFDFTGDVTYSGYTLTAIPNSSTIVNLPSPVTSTGSKSSSLSAPNTGIGLSTNKSAYTAIGAVLIASVLFVCVIYTKKHNSSTSKR
jgi:hypothetical protein